MESGVRALPVDKNNRIVGLIHQKMQPFSECMISPPILAELTLVNILVEARCHTSYLEKVAM